VPHLFRCGTPIGIIDFKLIFYQTGLTKHSCGTPEKGVPQHLNQGVMVDKSPEIKPIKEFKYSTKPVY